MKVCCRLRVAAVITVWLLFSVLPPAFAAEKGPVKIGFLAPYVGVWAQNGKDMENGFRLALEERGYRAGGRQLVVSYEDTEGKPEVGLTKARKLVENEKTQILAGIINSAVALSIRDLVISNKIPLVLSIAAAVDLTDKLKTPYIFRVSFANGQQDRVGGWYAYNKLGLRRMIIISPDIIAGREKAAGFIKTFKAAGGQVVEEIYAPGNTTDFGPYLTKIQAKIKPGDGVWIFFIGSGAIRLMQQWQEYGLKDTVPLFVLGDTVDDSYLPSLKDAALGVKNYCHYADTLDIPENRKFVQAYLAKYKQYPSMYSEEAYVTAKVITLALDAVKGDVENKEAFLAALRKVKFAAPRGPFSFDANQNAVIPIYLREVRKVEGRYANVVLDKIADNVDQNWSADKMAKSKN
jgi:branched-chain amino acid transport system substrate-binding protein